MPKRTPGSVSGYRVQQNSLDELFRQTTKLDIRGNVQLLAASFQLGSGAELAELLPRWLVEDGIALHEDSDLSKDGKCRVTDIGSQLLDKD